MNFSSENHDTAHPAILRALIKSNTGFAASYGGDGYTAKAIELFKEYCGREDIQVFFCFNGTGANNFALSSMAEKHSAILCSDIAHVYTAESTAPETFTGCRLYPVATTNGKIRIADLLRQLKIKEDLHRPPPGVLTITQPTEYGTIYNLKELALISKHCKQHNILLHIDGTRLFNALEAMNCTMAKFIRASGVDTLTLGGTKSGLLFGEAVIFFKSNRFRHLACNHKRSMQLASKNRFIAAQFTALLTNELWKKIAGHTNGLARYLNQQLSAVDSTKAAYPVETNTVFLNMGQQQFNALQSIARFYRWDDERNEVRLVFSFSNRKKDIDNFLAKYKRSIRAIV